MPPGVKVNLEDNRVTVRGPRGELSYAPHPRVSVALEGNALVVRRQGEDRLSRSLHGLSRSLLANMVEGVSQGFERTLELVGVGYRVQKAGEKLVFQVGYSHSVEFAPPSGISFAVEGTNRIKVVGVDKALVGQVAAHIRRIRPPDRYKGKGIKYAGEVLHLKPGKAGKGVKK